VATNGEIQKLSRFVAIGVAATAVHMAVVWSLISLVDTEPLLANLAAFLIAFVVSFTGQYFWTFRSTRRLSSAITRFFVVAFSAFLLNNVALVALLNAQLMSASLAAVIAVCVIPAISYVLGRFWAFQ
jgi:putative flippase GtrA